MKLLAPLLVCLMLTGCAHYVPQPGEATARLHVYTPGGAASLCQGDHYVFLPPDKDGFSPVPAGKEVKLVVHYQVSFGNIGLSCDVPLAFWPQEGKTYWLDGGLYNQRCSSDVFREDETSRTGLATEPATSQADCE